MTAKTTAPTYPRTIWIANNGNRLIKLTDDTQSFEAHQRKIAGLKSLNESRVAQGLDELSPGPINIGANVHTYLAPGLNRIEINSPRHEANAMSLVELFGRNAGELELVEDGPASLSIKNAIALAKLTASGAARKQWLEVEKRPAVRQALEERSAAAKAHRSEHEATMDKLASGGEVAS